MTDTNDQTGAGSSPPKLVAARIDGAEGDAILHLSRDTIPWHHRALAWGLGAAGILVCALASGWLIQAALDAHLGQSADPAQLRILRQSNLDLHGQIDRLMAIKPEDICKADALNRLDGTTPARPNGPTPGHQAKLDSDTLESLLEDATVLVVTNRGSGSGFFIAPNLIVTNAHVVDQADPQRLVVTSASIGRVLPAQLVVRSGPLQYADGHYVGGQHDYAVLRTIGPGSTHVLKLRSVPVKKLEEVTAAGYPGIYLSEGREFDDRPGRLPDMIPSKGAVRVIWSRAGTAVINHSAEINPGNSGGPLVDACGSVAGVNVFTNRIHEGDSAPDAVHYYALASDDLATFLRANNLQFQPSDQPCN